MTPLLPPGYIRLLPGRGEIFYRHHQHADTNAPTLLLLHGWTASADLQWYTVYERLSERYSFVAVDHRGHGRGMRSLEPFRLEDCADDAIALSQALGIDHVIPVGYSMGGPIGLLIAQRHPEHVAALVLAATAMEWQSTWRDRLDWSFLPIGETVFRSRAVSVVTAFWARLMSRKERLPNQQWVRSELRRSDPRALVQAGRALKHFDARAFAETVTIPAAMVITTKDRLVKPSKQHALAEAIHATIVEMPGDHLCNMLQGPAFADRLREAVDKVCERLT